ncbi:unnamed protein product, partial [Brenthis ino]
MLQYESVLFLIAICNLAFAFECPPERKHITHQESKLYNDLLCAYPSVGRPVKNHKSTVDVRVRFAIKYLSFDALEEILTLQSWVFLNWKDEYLTWSPVHYGGIKEIQIHSFKIWTPRMFLFNTNLSGYWFVHLYTTCVVTSSGVVTCVPQIPHSGICRTSLRSWPYDTQNCSLYFGSLMETGEHVNFMFYNHTPIQFDDFQDGPGWKLLKTYNERLLTKHSYSTNSTYPVLKYTFTLRREAAGPAATIVAPAIVIVILTLKGLLSEIKNNSRLMLIYFSLFAHFIFLATIGFVIPKFSSETPNIVLFIRDSMIVTLAGVLITILLMSLRKRADPVPGWILTINNTISSSPGKYVIFTKFDPNEVLEEKSNSEGSSTNNDKTRVALDWIQFANIINAFVYIVICLTYLIFIISYIPKES